MKRSEKVKEFVSDHKKEIIIAGVTVVVIAGTVIVLKQKTNVFDNIGSLKVNHKPMSTVKECIADEHKKWAHELADIHEAIYDTENNLKKARFNQANLQSDLKFAQEERFYFTKADVPEIQSKIDWYTDRIKKGEEALKSLYQKRDLHFRMEP